ncbi:hypothetical protein B0H21DRAFT_130892 [Amylocystis lapponica]|nr:hypothetical protein B0H21DRAFT_130892 [Amylocystis lapponica]
MSNPADHWRMELNNHLQRTIGRQTLTWDYSSSGPRHAPSWTAIAYSGFTQVFYRSDTKSTMMSPSSWCRKRKGNWIHERCRCGGCCLSCPCFLASQQWIALHTLTVPAKVGGSLRLHRCNRFLSASR